MNRKRKSLDVSVTIVNISISPVKLNWLVDLTKKEDKNRDKTHSYGFGRGARGAAGFHPTIEAMEYIKSYHVTSLTLFCGGV